MDLLAATHAITDYLGLRRGWPDWRATHAFQLAYNASLPGLTGTTPLKADGIYGPKTTAAVGETIAWFENLGQWTDVVAAPAAHPAAVATSGFSGEPIVRAPGGYWVWGRGCMEPGGGIVPAWGFVPGEPSHAGVVAGFDLGHIVEDITHPDAGKIASDVYHIATTVLPPALVAKEVVHVKEHGWGAIPADAEHAERDVAHAVRNVDQVVKDARPYVDFGLSAIEGVTSMIPGLGTGISAALGTAQAILDGGGPLEIAIRTAYATIPIPDGLRQITDPIVDAVLALASGKSVTDAAIYAIRDKLPPGLPQQVFDTLAHVLAKKVSIVKKPGAVQAHFVTRYTRGKLAANAASAHHIPPPVAAHLARIRPLPPGSAALAAVPRPRPAPPIVRPPTVVPLAPTEPAPETAP